jgi:uncharacterized protein YqeY
VAGDIRTELRTGLAEAIRRRDLVAIRVLRTTIAAIDNAEAPPLDPADLTGVSIERSPSYVGAREVPRLELAAAEVRALVESEIDERLDAASGYEQAGRRQRADDLRAEAAVLRGFLRP